MPTYSKAHERDENRLMNKAFTSSLAALLLCWLPLVGLFFAISGFIRMAVRLTRKHRVKRTFLTLFSVLVLLVSVGVFGWELYEYSRDPDVLDKGIREVWKAVTGEDELPWDVFSNDDSYDDYADYGEGLDMYDMPGDPDDAGYDLDYDADFDDAELEGFPEDDTEDLPDKDLFDQMMAERKSGRSLLP